MAVEIRVPQMGESVTEGVIAQWLKKVGDSVDADEPVVEVETDKITVEVPAPSAGVLSRQTVGEGQTVAVGDVLGEIDGDGAKAREGDGAKAREGDGAKAREDDGAAAREGGGAKAREDDRKPEDAREDRTSGEKHEVRPRAEGARPDEPAAPKPATSGGPGAMPAARAEAGRRGVDLDAVEGTGRGGRVLKEDVQRASAAATSTSASTSASVPSSARARDDEGRQRREERKALSPLRKRVAVRLVQSQQSTATLTTFNEVDMSQVMGLRKKWQDRFVARHGVKLGFMSFFVKAAIEALQAFPIVNTELDGDDLVYKYHYDIGVAVGGGKGLVVPVIRDADRKSFAEIEALIRDLGERARTNKLTLDDLAGGTFTVSNGGVYGSMLSTPILNPPQTAILGLHNIVERPVARDGRVEIRPVMFLALSYDHRVLDGREAVQFLVRIKECIEDPDRLMLEV